VPERFRPTLMVVARPERLATVHEPGAGVRRMPFALTMVTARDHHPFGDAMRMAAMDHFDHILNWELKQGSHVFPGEEETG
jgi:hypothetical protein